MKEVIYQLCLAAMAPETQLEMKELIIAITLVDADGLHESTLQHVHPPTEKAQSRTVETSPPGNGL